MRITIQIEDSEPAASAQPATSPLALMLPGQEAPAVAAGGQAQALDAGPAPAGPGGVTGTPSEGPGGDGSRGQAATAGESAGPAPAGDTGAGR